MEILVFILIMYIVIEIPICIGMGIIFKKNNLGIIKGIIPFYNKIILIKKYQLPNLHLLLGFIPIIGLYTNYEINCKLAEENNKNKFYAIELTILPFVFNVLLGLEMTQKPKLNKINSYVEKEKNISTKQKEQKEEKKQQQEENIWLPKPKIKSNTIYKASRNSLNEKINLETKNEIIDNKIKQEEKQTNTKTCPKCGTKIPENIEVCYICGTKL